MYLKVILLKFFVILALSSICSQAGSTFEVKYVIPGRLYQSRPHEGYERLSVWCYRGVPKHILHFWQTVRLQLNIDGNDWETYIGHTDEDVLKEYQARRSFWSFNLPFWGKADTLYLNPFNSSCIGISTSQDHSIFVHVIRIDFWRLLLFCAGVFMFLAANRLSSHPLFYYSCGITLGVSTSLLIAIYFISKLIPKKPAVYGFLAGGWAISAYLVQLVLSNLQTIALVYHHYVLAYFTLAALISFIICYRFGPVSDPRTMSLIRWSLQGGGLVAMYMSSSFPEASMAAIIILLTYYNFPRRWMLHAFALWRSRFPPKPRLLTEDEYHEEGARETLKALDELRKYCSSPECNQWRTVLRLKSPTRFAEFMEGQSHLSDEEMLAYELDESTDPGCI